jgi:hypothetical protein
MSRVRTKERKRLTLLRFVLSCLSKLAQISHNSLCIFLLRYSHNREKEIFSFLSWITKEWKRNYFATYVLQPITTQEYLSTNSRHTIRIPGKTSRISRINILNNVSRKDLADRDVTIPIPIPIPTNTKWYWYWWYWYCYIPDENILLKYNRKFYSENNLSKRERRIIFLYALLSSNTIHHRRKTIKWKNSRFHWREHWLEVFAFSTTPIMTGRSPCSIKIYNDLSNSLEVHRHFC